MPEYSAGQVRQLMNRDLQKFSKGKEGLEDLWENTWEGQSRCENICNVLQSSISGCHTIWIRKIGAHCGYVEDPR